MDMGLGHGDDPQTVMPGEVGVVGDVAPRIDHGRLPLSRQATRQLAWKRSSS